ncbi:hypothetical protein HSBAA_39370 [Vreelandella sulfidaeris]|uniref:Carbohydrate kinase PfkB domain-containing protein n=1 Tax=Vreelandella sulfidaeris TaxID=115553 RepID=A0A455UDE4_9GAMM|nr:hypothetical protein HSBAA_39370 [Halomonas sulfidaeris]
MTPVIAFGEALVDMLSSRLGQQPMTRKPLRPMRAGRLPMWRSPVPALGVPSQFLGMVGDDTFGHFIVRELDSHGVDTSGVVYTQQSRTALAFVSRDTHGERTFDFYRPPAADLLYRLEHLPQGVFENPAILHLCSNSLTDPEIADVTLAMATMAKRAGCLVSVDANLRHNLWPSREADTHLVTQLLDSAELLKLSLEELDYLRADHPAEAWLSERLASGLRSF